MGFSEMKMLAYIIKRKSGTDVFRKEAVNIVLRDIVSGALSPVFVFDFTATKNVDEKHLKITFKHLLAAYWSI